MATDEGDSIDDGGFDALDLEDEDDVPAQAGAPSTFTERRREQTAVFESWLQSDASQTRIKRKKDDDDEDSNDQLLSVHSLMAKQESAQIVKNPREYQLELFERAKSQNTIAVLDTGSGKTLIAVLLIRWIIDQELESRAAGNAPKITFFLVASVTLVLQQNAVLEANLDHKIAHFYGSMNVQLWSKTVWKQHFLENKVIVCTADILLQCLSRNYINISQINLLVFDEAHHTKKNHAYARIIKDHYLTEPDKNARPRVFGMTASPVDSKDDAVQSAAGLESLLDSRIATATDLSLQQVLKRQDELILTYATLRQPFETEFLSATKARFSHIDVFEKIFNTCKDIAAELGPWCADQYLVDCFAEKHLRRYEAAVEQRFNANSVNKSVADLDQELADVRRASEYVLGRWKLLQDHTYGNFGEHDLSAKVRVLCDYLAQHFERPSDHKCLVFVNQRHNARLLATLFQKLNLKHLHAKHLTGAGSAGMAEQNFSFREQVVTMMDFRKGEVNCLFATSVAEEGLDVPACNLVVRFSLYNTMVQYVQSRGRARRKNSKFIHMIENGNSIQNHLMQEVRHQEMAMRGFCHGPLKDRLLGNEVEVLLAKENVLRVYVEPSSGAKLTYENALRYLATFVSNVPTDSDEPQHPTCVVTSSGAKYIAEVVLPPGAPLRSVVGSIHSQKKLAKRSAAFEACLEMRRKNFMDEHFLPTYVKQLPAMRNALLAVNSKKVLAYDMKTKPVVWQQTRGNTPDQLFVTIIDFPDGLSREHQPLAMLTRTPIPQSPRFPVFLDDGRESTVVSRPHSVPLKLENDNLALLTTFTLRVFKDVFSKTYENDPAQLSYWLAPVIKGTGSDVGSSSAPLDWQLIKEVHQVEEYKWSPEMPNEALENRFIVDPWDGGRKFISKGVSQFLKPLDPVPEGCAKSKWKGTILNYSNSLYKATREKYKDTWDVTQPVMETDKIRPRRNLLASPGQKETKEATRAPLCPQPLRISVLPPRIAVSCFIWPAIIWRFESYLIALEAADFVGVQCGPGMALAAITKDSDNSGDHETQERINFQHGMGNNYERLEFMGDCFLKTATTISTFIQNPNDNEFEFHVKRMLMLCNKNLFRVAKELKLYEFIRSKSFNRRMWYPEGPKLLAGKGAQTTEEIEEERRVGSKHSLGEKTIADVCEAMIGAAFMAHDKPGSWNSNQWDNAVSVVTKLVDSDDHRMLKWDDYKAAYNLPAYQTAASSASQRDTAAKVEQEHDYRFRYPRLLRSAFIHPSQPFLYEKLPNYQRLEFLGDALLDMASITYIFNKSPDKDPQWLTEHKMAIIGNRALGMIAVNTGFYKHIRHNHSILEQQIREYVTELTEAKNNAAGAKDYWTTVSEPPKCLADIVEAYIGAMFIDSDFNYHEVQRFFDTHILPYFEDMTLYDSYANNHPCTRLHHMLDQTYGCQQYRILAKEVPALHGLDNKEVVVAVMIHNEIIAHDRGKSARYARVRVANIAMEQLEGLAPYEFRQKFGCECTRSDGGETGVHADCVI